MPKCPKCKKNIETLNWSTTLHHNGWLEQNSNGDFYHEEDFRVGSTDYNYHCPECDEVLFVELEEAGEFLNKQKKQEVLA